MRVNLYSQELTGETSVVETTAEDTGRRFFGVRVFLASPDVLHSPPRDDDRSAVTFWLDEDFTADQAIELFADLLAKCEMLRDEGRA